MGHSISTISVPLKKIGKWKEFDKWDSNELNESERFRCFELCSMLPLRNSNDKFHDRLAICDENVILCVNRKRLAQWLGHKHFPTPKIHQHMMRRIVSLSAIGVTHYSFLETNQIITASK